MKYLAMVALLIVSNLNATTFPKKALLECKIVVTPKSVNVLKIGVENLGTPKASLINLATNENEGPILFSKKNKEVGSQMNDQGGDIRVNEKTIEFHGDGDGCTYIRLVLFKDTGYTRGWASESGSEVPHWYTKDVSCKVSALN